jgi:hypothetical protein
MLHQDWDLIEKEETRLLRAMTVQESLGVFLSLQMSFEWQLQQTASLFAPERESAMIELQNRLRRLVDR